MWLHRTNGNTAFHLKLLGKIRSHSKVLLRPPIDLNLNNVAGLTLIKANGSKAEIIGKCIMHYAKQWLPGMDMGELKGYGLRKNGLQFSTFSGKEKENNGYSKEQKTIVENLVSITPSQQEVLSCKFLLQIQKMAMMHAASLALDF
ncbi:hypothetical protein L6164_012385 [Bauhinia variegata]|uniref:Uncharacterized protein n=1 Tax=Bauhinia variegata TaxID=167791 RepID=A0ACB9PF38_BAUVA|nr:hypothetical protein L6164_012385 [Bauhinia variegata]